MQVGTATSTLNPTFEYFNSPGIWVTYIVVLLISHFLLLSFPLFSVAVAWTLTCSLHNIIMYFVLHWEKGSPYETLDQGEGQFLTQWEQFDDGVQFSPTKKFLLVVPVILFLMASFYTEYNPVHGLINGSTLIFMAILPKLPQFYGVRIFGINRW